MDTLGINCKGIRGAQFENPWTIECIGDDLYGHSVSNAWMQKWRATNFAHAHYVVTEHYSCLTDTGSPKVSVISFPCIAGKLIWSYTGSTSSSPTMQNLLSSSLLSKNVKIKIYKDAVFWDVTQRWVLVLYRRFGTT
jgi:hypothetical protein